MINDSLTQIVNLHKMKNYTLAKSLMLLFFLNSTILFSQVGINTTNPAGALDIDTPNLGFVMPRTNLSSKTDVATVKTPQGSVPVDGTLIYDYGTNITGGFYYYENNQWNMLLNDAMDKDEYLGSYDQTLTNDRTIDLNGHDLNFDVGNTGANVLALDTDFLTFSRNPENALTESLINAKGGLAFNIDSNNNNGTDLEYFSWGHNGTIAQGTGSTNYKELMRLDNTGLGVGTNDPRYLFHVKETASNLNIAKFEAPDFPIFGGFIIEDNAGNNTTKFVISPGNIANNNSAAWAGLPSANANAKNSVTFDIEGSTKDIYTFMEGVIRPGYNNLTSLGTTNHRFTDLYLVNSPNVSSDIRLKNNIKEIEYGLETINKIDAVSYILNDDKERQVHLGFKAQQLQELIPEIVEEAPETTMLGVSYTEMIPVLTKAVQELSDKLDILSDENAALKKQNLILMEKLNK